MTDFSEQYLQQTLISMHQIILKEGALSSWGNHICPHCGNSTDLARQRAILETEINFSFGHIYWCPICHAQWSSISVRPGMHMIFGEKHTSLDPCTGGIAAALEQIVNSKVRTDSKRY